MTGSGSGLLLRVVLLVTSARELLLGSGFVGSRLFLGKRRLEEQSSRLAASGDFTLRCRAGPIPLQDEGLPPAGEDDQVPPSDGKACGVAGPFFGRRSPIRYTPLLQNCILDSWAPICKQDYFNNWAALTVTWASQVVGF